jgi:hypothetical protein
VNLGGTKFAITKDKLLKHKGSYFEQIVVTDHSQQLPGTNEYFLFPPFLFHSSNPNDPSLANRVFIDRDPELFRYVFATISTGVLKSLRSVDKLALEHEYKFFNIPFPKPVFSPRVE